MTAKPRGALSLAVFALAVEDMKDLERVIISATPFAFLEYISLAVRVRSGHDALLVAVELAELHERRLLLARLLLSLQFVDLAICAWQA